LTETRSQERASPASAVQQLVHAFRLSFLHKGPTDRGSVWSRSSNGSGRRCWSAGRRRYPQSGLPVFSS